MTESHDPIARFREGLDRAIAARLPEPTAVALATADGRGRPAVRMVLLKSVDERGFTFYTNLESRKGEHLRANPHASLCFFWQPLELQVRVEGPVEPVSESEADAYFASRPRASQLGAWASLQSRPLTSREELDARVAEVERRFAGEEIPRPPFWSGYRVVPDRIEFWFGRPGRLHDRELYLREDGGWRLQRLYP